MLSLCHTSIKPDIQVIFSTWSWCSHHLVSELSSINRIISFWKKKFLIVPAKIRWCPNFFFSLNLRQIKKIIISFCYCPKDFSIITKNREKRKWKKKQIVQKSVYWFLPQKTKQGKSGSNQLGISSILILWLLPFDLWTSYLARILFLQGCGS